MQEPSIKRNFVLNLINTVTGLLFPLITFPYVSRILFAEGIGRIQFFQSIIDYIALGSALGIPLYAVREISRIREKIVLQSKTTAEILLLHAFLTLGGYVLVLILACTVGRIKVDIPLFLLLSVVLFFNMIGVSWFYQAIEDFKYITIRTLIVRISSLIALFIFVKVKDDLLIYAAITVIANAGGNIFNFLRLRKYINYREMGIKNLHPWKHLKPALQIFTLNLIISIYVNLDSVMLGFMKNEQAVGYYAAAMRLSRTVLGIVTSLGAVLLPRFSNMIGKGQFEEFNALANKAVSFVIAISLPMSIGIIFLAAPIIHLFCGSGFEPSILTLQLVAPIILFIGLSGIIGMQILYPQGKEKLIIIATGLGAFVNFFLNLFLIPSFSQYASGFATSVAELIVTLVMVIIGKKYIPFHFATKQNMQYIIASVLIIISLSVIKALDLSDISSILIGILLSIVVYFSYLHFKKDIFVRQIEETILKIIQKKQ